MKKNDVYLAFEDDQYLELRKILFENNLTMHQFFGHVVELLTINDERMLEILEEVKENKQKQILNGKIVKNVNSDSIYELIEKQLKEEI